MALARAPGARIATYRRPGENDVIQSHRRHWIAFRALVAIFAGCGGQASKSSIPPLSVSPASATAGPGDAPITFTATLSDSSETVDWSLSADGAAAGTLSAATGSIVQYAPPSSVDAARTVTLTAAAGGVSQSIKISLAPLPRFYADPSAGNDDHPGTLSRPLRTIREAFRRMAAGATKTTLLLPGTYNEGSGEDWEYSVPAGITLKGAEGSSAQVVLRASGNGKRGLILASDATVSDLSLTGFAAALQASSGRQILTRLAFEYNQSDLQLSNSASVTLHDSSSAGAQVVVLAVGRSELSVQGGTYGRTAALATIGDSAVIHFSDADLSGGQLYAGDSSALTLDNVKLHDVYGRAILVAGASAQLAIRGGSVYNIVSNGSDVLGAVVTNGKTTIDGAVFSSGNPTIIGANGGTLSLTNSRIENGKGNAVVIRGKAAFKMRRTVITKNLAAVAFVDGAIDLGTAEDPGGNTLKDNANYGLLAVGDPAEVQAVGNTWNANVQGADENGHYRNGDVIEGPRDELARGANFFIAKGTSLHF
jgi:hypothetical protein